jgi:hypothetical protein
VRCVRGWQLVRRDSRTEERGGRGGVLPGRSGREELNRCRGELEEVTATFDGHAGRCLGADAKQANQPNKLVSSQVYTMQTTKQLGIVLVGAG